MVLINPATQIMLHIVFFNRTSLKDYMDIAGHQIEQTYFLNSYNWFNTRMI